MWGVKEEKGKVSSRGMSGYQDAYGKYSFSWPCPMLLAQIQAAIFQTFMFRQINVEFFVENYALGEITKTPEELLRDD